VADFLMAGKHRKIPRNRSMPGVIAMYPRSPKLIAAFALAAAGLIVSAGQGVAQPAPAPASTPPAAARHLIPQSLRISQIETTEQLSVLAKKKGPVGAAAGRVLALYTAHVAREREFILPPLTLLPLLADGKVTPDMAWALAMTDRVKAEREEIFNEHTRITEALNRLVVAGAEAHDNYAKEFAESAAADSLNDLEVLEPTLMLIGDILHSKLSAAH
jgi:hypothetical protein